MAFKAFALGVFLCVQSSLGVTLILSDFHDTIVETRRNSSCSGTFETKVILYRIEQLGSVIIPRVDEPEQVEVTPFELERIRKSLGSGPLEPGAIKETVKLSSGKTIHPGYFFIRNPDSYKYFMEAPAGKNYLLRDFKAAELREPKEGFKGPFWDSMVEILKTKEGAQSFGVISAAGYSEKEWQEFFEYLQSKKYIKHLPNFSLFRSISRPEFDKYSIDWDVPGKKVAIAREFALALRFQSLSDSDVRLAPDGKSKGKYHSILFADDKKETVHGMSELFFYLSRSQLVSPVKYGIFNAGTNVRTQRDRFWIVSDTGIARSAVDREIISDASNCALRLAE